MKQITTYSILCSLCVTLIACQNTSSEVHTDNFLVFGTIVEVTLYGVDKDTSERVFKEIDHDLNYMHYAFHAWKSGPLGRINQLLQATGEFSANPVLIPLITKAKELEQTSLGYFNPGLSHLLKLWGYQDELLPEGPPPSEDEIKQVLAYKPSLSSITIKGIRISNTNPNLKLDLGGIAKGYAIEKICANAKDLGVDNMLVGAGGDIKAVGQKGNAPWLIGIAHPREDGTIASIQLQDGEAIFTSGDYEQYYEYEGKRYHHILNPFTGYPATHTWSVTVIHNDATTADAAATALFVAGPDNWQKVAQSMDIDYVMLIDAHGEVHISPAMLKRIHWEQEQAPVIHISQQQP